MTILYTKLARAYHEMYQSIFDYKGDFELYAGILRRYGCRSVLEIGCGSGNLASLFRENGYEYTGLDLSEDMLKIAREINPASNFISGDMRSLEFIKEFDAVIITGRSFTYMTTNADVNNALKSVYRNLKKDGLLIFDNFNAEEIFMNFKESIENSYRYGNRSYKRVSSNSLNLENGWTWNWEAAYTIEEPGKAVEVYYDKAVLRAFTEDELSLFLRLNSFDIEQVIKDKLFMFIARKQTKI